MLVSKLAGGFRISGETNSGIKSVAARHCDIPSHHKNESEVTRRSAIHSISNCGEAGPNWPPLGGLTNHFASKDALKAAGISFSETIGKLLSMGVRVRGSTFDGFWLAALAFLGRADFSLLFLVGTSVSMEIALDDFFDVLAVFDGVEKVSIASGFTAESSNANECEVSFKGMRNGDLHSGQRPRFPP